MTRKRFEKLLKLIRVQRNQLSIFTRAAIREHGNYQDAYDKSLFIEMVTRYRKEAQRHA